MTLAGLVAHYGYAAVFAGSLLEGETVLLVAGAAAQHGYLSFIGVVLLAFMGGTLGDQVLFAIGRRHGVALLRRYPKLAARAEPVRRSIRRHQTFLVVGVRFMYGVRLVGPLVIGMSEVPVRRFLLLNMVGAALWAPLIVGIGYGFGHTLEWLLRDIARFEALGLALLVVLATAFGVWRWLHRGEGPGRARGEARDAEDAAGVGEVEVRGE